MDIGEKYLPIGSVVLLKNGKKELMITSYCIIPKGEVYDKNGKVEFKEGQMLDYGACTYPEGILNTDAVVGFNHDDINEVLFRGYETDTSKEFQKFLKQRLEEIDKEKETKEEKKEDSE